MASNLNQKHVWVNVRVAMSDSFIEARETKPMETGSVLVFVVGPIACLLMAMLVPTSPDSLTRALLFICGGIGAVIGFAILILYRPPRVIRLYPLEQVAHVSRRFLMIQFPGKWHDLSQGEPITIKTAFTATQNESISAGKAIVVILLMLLGPLGLIVGLLIGGSRDKISLPTYGLTYPGWAGRPLALFTQRAACEKLVRSYVDAQKLSQ